MIRKIIHFFVKKLNILLGYRIWDKGEEPKV